MKLKACQCGGRPVWTPAERERRRGRGPAVRPERLQCPGCRNRTCSDVSRERLAAEWNSAGWCGQGPAAPEYVPFGEEWRAQMMRMRKPDLVRLLADACRRGMALDGLVARLRVRRDRSAYNAIIDRLVQRGIIEKADAAGAKRNLAKGGAAWAR